MAKQTSDSKQRSQNAQNRQSTGSKPSGNAGNRQGIQTQNKQSPQTQNRQPASRAAQRVAKQQQKQQELQLAKRSRNITLFSVLGVVIIGLALIGGIIYYNQSHPQAATPVNAAYPAVDGISCDAGEQLAYHIHAHLSIYINGTLSPVPQQVGIASDGSCFYWLHTHDTTGVIHIESPTQKNYTLGNFFDEWSQRFSTLGYPSELDFTSGWQIWVNGKVYKGDFRSIQMTTHTLITMAYNSPNVKPDTTYAWNGL